MALPPHILRPLAAGFLPEYCAGAEQLPSHLGSGPSHPPCLLDLCLLLRLLTVAFGHVYAVLIYGWFAAAEMWRSGTLGVGGKWTKPCEHCSADAAVVMCAFRMSRTGLETKLRLLCERIQ